MLAMPKITLLHIADDKNITGCLISLVDLHYNLLEYNVDHDLVLYFTNYNIGMKYCDFIRKSISDSAVLNNAQIKHIQSHNTVNSDIIIATTECLTSLCNIDGTYSDFSFKFDCDLMIFLDTLGLWIASIYNKLSELQEYIQNINTLLLCSPFNFQFNIFSDVKEYYHKFSNQRINYLKNKYMKPRYQSMYTAHKYKSLKDNQIQTTDEAEFIPHNYAGYIYHRWFERKGMFAENIGKMIYEFVLLDKPVQYKAINKTMNDGLHYYLKYLDVDDSFDQYLSNISYFKRNIEDRLFMKRDDLLLKLLRN